MVLAESPNEQLKRLVHEIERLRADAASWQRAGKPETAQELRTLVSLLTATVERIEQSLLRARQHGVPTIFDPGE